MQLWCDQFSVIMYCIYIAVTKFSEFIDLLLLSETLIAKTITVFTRKFIEKVL
jgi:hypothetical protein